MSTYTVVRGHKRHTERLNNSVNGNPAYRVAIESESGKVTVHRTSSDSGWCYGIDNPENSGLLDFYLTKAGRIAFARPVERTCTVRNGTYTCCLSAGHSGSHETSAFGGVYYKFEDAYSRIMRKVVI